MPDGLTPQLLPPVLESLPDPVLVLDSVGRVAAVNRAAERWCGRTRDEFIQRDLHELLEPHSFSRLLAYLTGTATEFTGDLEFVHASGTLLHAGLHCARDKSGQVHIVAREAAPRKRPDEPF